MYSPTANRAVEIPAEEETKTSERLKKKKKAAEFVSFIFYFKCLELVFFEEEQQKVRLSCFSVFVSCFKNEL